MHCKLLLKVQTKIAAPQTQSSVSVFLSLQNLTPKNYLKKKKLFLSHSNRVIPFLYLSVCLFVCPLFILFLCPLHTVHTLSHSLHFLFSSFINQKPKNKPTNFHSSLLFQWKLHRKPHSKTSQRPHQNPSQPRRAS